MGLSRSERPCKPSGLVLSLEPTMEGEIQLLKLSSDLLICTLAVSTVVQMLYRCAMLLIVRFPALMSV